MEYLQEIEALQVWLKAAAGLASHRLKDAKPNLARPVVLFETPSRRKVRNLDRYRYVVPVRQYGKLFVNNLEEAASKQEALIKDLEERVNVLQVYANKLPVPGIFLKAVVIEFGQAEGLDIPFTIEYEVTYSRTKPAEPPHATTVVNRVTSQL